MNDIKYQIIKVKVSEKSQMIKFSADTDKKFKRVKGLFVSLPSNEALFESTLELKIADVEIFPEDFEVKLLTCGDQIAPNDRFYTKLDEEALGSRLEGRFKDGGTSRTYPFTALIYLRLEEKA